VVFVASGIALAIEGGMSRKGSCASLGRARNFLDDAARDGFKLLSRTKFLMSRSSKHLFGVTGMSL